MADEKLAMAKKSTASSSATSAPRRRTKPVAAEAADSSHGGNGGVSATPTPEEIAEAAYHRYLSRGAMDGSDFDDWVEAERELRSRR